MTITEFLLARIAEDEQVAREVATQMREVVARGNYKRIPATDADVNLPPVAAESYDGFPVVNTSPARVLAECEAKRKVLADPLLHTFMSGEGISVAGARIVRTLAAIYADHPDYDPEWTPRA